MAGVVKWEIVSCKQQDHTQLAKHNAGGSRNGYKYIHRSTDIGYVRKYSSFMSHSIKSGLKQKTGQYVVAKVRNADTDANCSSESIDQNNGISCGAHHSKGSQLEALESYFSKLNPEKAQQFNSTPQKNEQKKGYSLSKSKAEASMIDYYYNCKNRLDSMEDYFDKLNTGTENSVNSNTNNYKKDYLLFDDKSFLDLHTDDRTSGFCLINFLAAINIAVLLFEVATPVRNSDLENLSLPLMYGAKINNLILSGEWWRLLTPMCLHSGFLHVAVGCWMLLTFGPRVSRAYGQVTFFLIYILGGICGNLTSFVHTPELTVCGTGPVFALIGAWIVYQNQNKEVVNKHVSESMFKQAVIATALSFLLSSFGRIDDWTHLGATISGLIFGYLTCPGVELDNDAKGGRKEAVALLRRQANPCKSLVMFTVSIFVLASFALAYAMQIEILDT